VDQSPQVERKLAAILAADVVGYSRLMGQDETGTLARLKALRRELVEPLIARHHGRIVKLMGDGALTEFASVVDAVACAVEIQRGMAERTAAMPEDQRIAFRIGVNLGDLIIDGDDLYGDGVNIAARLEALAEPGGIVLSGPAYDQARNKPDVGFEFLGEQRLKNITKPVKIYRVLLDAADAGKMKHRRRWLVPAAAAVVLLVAAGAGLALWPGAGALLSGRHAIPAAVPGGKPSIAVLPFGNLSGEAQQAYFAEGLTDDLITDLSKVSGLLVIARNSSFAYRDKPVDVVTAELGVRYVLQGSVRRTGDAVRINVQLIDGATGNNVWADRYDRDYAKIFELQDEVIRHIVEALAVHLTEGEKSQIARLPTSNLEAYDYYLRAEQNAYVLASESLDEAMSLYRRAIALDPKFADAYAGYARVAVDVFGYDFQPLMQSAVARHEAYEAAGRALEINPETPRAYAVLGLLQLLDGETEEAIASVEKAVALDPNSADAELNLAIVRIYAGQQPEALAAMERVLQLDPKPRSHVYDYYGLALYMNRRYEEAIKVLPKAPLEQQSDLGREVLAMANARLGRMEDARNAVEAILKRGPATNLATWRVDYSHHRRQVDLDHRLDAMRDAGLPELPYGFSGRPEDRLDGKAIRALAVDKVWIGRQKDGAPFLMQVSAKGDYAQRGPRGMMVGKIAFEDDLMCMRSEAVAMGRKFCTPVYRNPGGSSETQDEYVFADIATIWYFSVAP
jgi:adenylate cyclase